MRRGREGPSERKGRVRVEDGVEALAHVRVDGRERVGRDLGGDGARRARDGVEEGALARRGLADDADDHLEFTAMLGRRRHGRRRLVPPPQRRLRRRAVGRDLGRRNGRVDALLVVVRRRRGGVVVLLGRLVDRLRVVVGDVIVCSLNRGHDAGLARLQLVLHGRRRRARDRTGRALRQLGERQRIGHDRQPQRAARRRVTAAHLERQVDVAGEGASVEPDTRAVPLESSENIASRASSSSSRAAAVSASGSSPRTALRSRNDTYTSTSRARHGRLWPSSWTCVCAPGAIWSVSSRGTSLSLRPATRSVEQGGGAGVCPPRRAGNDQRLEAWQAIGHRERAGAS